MLPRCADVDLVDAASEVLGMMFFTDVMNGNVTGEPPYTGELQHPGWRVKEIRLPTTAEGQDPFVVQPAEVQV